MPTQTPQKKEKKDYKLELLEEIQKKYGLSSAAVMDKALKTQDKQIEQAMLEGGAKADDIAQTKGINLDLLGKLVENQGQVKSEGVSQQPQQQGSGYQTKPASSPFGFGGMSMQNGQFVEQQPGIIGGLLAMLAGADPKRAANTDLKRLMGVSEIQKNQRPGGGMSQVEQDSYALNNELKRRQIDQIDQTGQVPTKEDLLSGIPENEQEDYLIKPVKQTIRGIVNTVPILERKKSLPAKQLEDLGAFENTQQDLSAVVDRLKSTGLQLGPGFSTRPGAISDMLGQIKGKDFAGIKADIGRNFQLYRKTTTGVAAGYPELNMLAPNYPKATDTNEVFIQKSIDVMKDIQRNREIMLDHFNKGGYAVSKLRKQPEQEQPQTQQGWTQDKESRYQELLKKRGK